MKTVNLLLCVCFVSLSACKSTPTETNTEALLPLKAKPMRTVYQSRLPKGSWAEFSFYLVDDGKGKLKPSDIKLVKESSSEFLSLADDFAQGFEKWRYSKKKVQSYENIRFVLKLTPPNTEPTARCNRNDECKLNARNEETDKKWFNHLTRINSLAITCNISSGVGYTLFQREYRRATNDFEQYVLKKNPNFSENKLKKIVKKRQGQVLKKIQKTIKQSPKTCEIVPKAIKSFKE